jgi:exonuclease SbcC
MIPINLKITGLYSYLEEQEIDFTRLTEAGLFGIFGKVGSGKSTILEAMSFAIYADTARFSKSGDNRYYNMLNLKSNEAIIDFTFKASKQNTIYNIYVRLLRNNKDFETVNLKDHNYYLVNGKIKTPIDNKIVLDEIGIDYDNFKRTVIIPQGQFKDFLELKPTARTNMLKDLFGLQRFDLSSKLIIIEKQNISKLDVLKGEMLGKEAITEELIQKVKVDSISKEAIVNESKILLKVKEDELNAYNSLETDFNNFNKKNTDYQQKIKYSESFKAKETEAKEFETITNLFAGIFKEIKDLSEDQSNRIKSEIELKNRISNGTEIYEKVKIKFIDVEKAFNSNDKLKDLSGKLNKLSYVLDAEHKLEKLDLEIKKTEEKINIEIVEKQNSILNLIDRLEKENILLDKRGLDDAYITAMNAWYLHVDFAEKTLIKLKEEKDEILQKIISGRQKLNKDLREKTEALFNEMPNDFNEEEFDKAYRTIQNTVKNELEKLLALKSDLDLKCKLQEYAGHLEDGHACALCGSLEHPSPLSSANFDHELKELNDAIESNNNKQENLKNKGTQILKGFVELNNLNAILNTIDGKIKAENLKFENLKTELPKGNFSLVNKTDFDNSIKEIEESKKKIKLNNERISKNKEEQKLLVANLEIEKNGLDEMKKKYQTEKGFLLANSEDLKEFDRKIYLLKSIDEINTEAKLIEIQIEKNVIDFENVTNEKRKVEDGLLMLKGTLEVEQKEIALVKNKLELALSHYSQKLIENKVTEDTVKVVLAKQFNLESIKKEIEDYKEALNLLTGEINVLKEKLNGKVFDKNNHDLLKNNVSDLKTKYEEANKDLITLNNEIINLSAELLKKKQIQEDFEKLTVRATDISSMKSLFKSSGFVDFVSRRYLQNVVNIANARFYKMSRQKFKMELSADGEFLVRDFMNEGKTRLLKSLSGGQTFQAALSLSLALSESIQRNAGVDQNFFFLDEGFGTLDKESLQTVFETLKSLRQENRVVGLISHVEELQQEMDVFLNIQNDVELGTTIKGSWEL